MLKHSYLFVILIVKLCVLNGAFSQTYLVGGDFDYPPFSYIDKNGQPAGVDIDILEAISKQSGIEFKYQLSEWNDALNAVYSGETDIVTGIIFSEEREQFLDFTNPLHTEYYSIFIRKDLRLDDIADLYKYHLMVLRKDISIDKFLIPMGLYKDYVVAKSLPEALAGVEWGRADYVVAPHSLGMNEIEKNNYQNITVKGPPVLPSIYCLAVKKGDTRLLAILNKGISDLRASRELAEIYSRWNFYERDEYRYRRIMRIVGVAVLGVIILLIVVFVWIWVLRRQIRKKTEYINSKNKELQKLNAEKDRLFSVIAHDLRSPFNSIIGFSDLLVKQASEKEYDRIEEFAKIIQDSSKRAMNLLTNLMEWSLSQTGVAKFNPDSFDLDKTIHDITLLFSDMADQKSIKIRTDLCDENTVIGDKQMISTVLRNLISNAIKFTQVGGTVSILSKREDGKILISVVDSGVGISKLAQKNLFNIDSKTSTPGTQKEKGTGLGLILCKEFIDKHKEQIWVESSPGEGSAFSFTLPLAS